MRITRNGNKEMGMSGTFKIDPKTIELDRMERSRIMFSLETALQVQRKKAAATKVDKTRDNLEWSIACMEDLHTKFKKLEVPC